MNVNVSIIPPDNFFYFNTLYIHNDISPMLKSPVSILFVLALSLENWFSNLVSMGHKSMAQRNGIGMITPLYLHMHLMKEAGSINPDFKTSAK